MSQWLVSYWQADYPPEVWPPDWANVDTAPPLVKQNQLKNDESYVVDLTNPDLTAYHANVQRFFQQLYQDTLSGAGAYCHNAQACTSAVQQFDGFMLQSSLARPTRRIRR